MIRFTIPLLLIAAVSSPAQSITAVTTCDSIDKVDFMNSELNFESSSMRFRDGRACTSDGADPAACDWEHTVTLDKVLAPEPGLAVRLIIINSSHQTGSGMWGHVLLFECKGGKVTSPFNQSYLQGVKVENLGDKEVTLLSGEWLKSDPECCPSRQKREVLRWDRKKGGFTLSERTVHR